MKRKQDEAEDDGDDKDEGDNEDGGDYAASMSEKLSGKELKAVRWKW